MLTTNLQKYLAAFLSLVLLAGPGLAAKLGAFGLPTWAHAVTMLVGIATLLVQLKSDSTTPVSPALAAKRAAQRGFARGDALASAAICLLFAIPALLLACLTPAKQAQAVTDVAGVADCVVQHEGEPPAQIAVTCGLQGAADVIGLLAAMDRRMARKLGDAGAK
jgi:hydrogenase/urease accessory protein HupE